MAKLCKVDNCSQPVFSKNYCKGHQYLRTDKKEKEPKDTGRMVGLMPLPMLLELVQKTHNTYIRLRDKGKRCICCSEGMSEQAGHFFPVGSYSGVRFDEINTNGQSEKCNCGEYGNITGYRRGLIDRYGVEAYEALCVRAKATRFYKWEREELEQIISMRKQQIKQLNKQTA